MNCALATASDRALLGLLLWLVALLPAACAKDAEGPESTVLSTRRGDTSIQVTEGEQGGEQVVRISTTFRGEENNIVLRIDQPIYEVEIPLSVEQILPQQQASAAGTPGGTDFQDLLIAQYLEAAQESMLNGDYHGALRQVNLVLLSKPSVRPRGADAQATLDAFADETRAFWRWRRSNGSKHWRLIPQTPK